MFYHRQKKISQLNINENATQAMILLWVCVSLHCKQIYAKHHSFTCAVKEWFELVTIKANAFDEAVVAYFVVPISESCFNEKC